MRDLPGEQARRDFDREANKCYQGFIVRSRLSRVSNEVMKLDLHTCKEEVRRFASRYIESINICTAEAGTLKVLIYVPPKRVHWKYHFFRIGTDFVRIERFVRPGLDGLHMKHIWSCHICLVLSLFNGISTLFRLFNAKDNGVHTFPKGICPKVNVIARLEYELAYYDSAVHRFNHYTTRTPHICLCRFRLIYSKIGWTCHQGCDYITFWGAGRWLRSDNSAQHRVKDFDSGLSELLVDCCRRCDRNWSEIRRKEEIDPKQFTLGVIRC